MFVYFEMKGYIESLALNRSNVIKLFTSVIYDFLLISKSVCPWQGFPAKSVCALDLEPTLEHLKSASLKQALALLKNTTLD